MKAIVIGLSLLMMVGAASAQEKTTSAPAEKNVIAEATKKPRKKKVEMCSECGKPEKECECHNDEKKKEEKKDQR